MTLVVNDRVQEVSTSTGSGPFVLGGGVTGYQTFSVGIGNTNSTYYTITNGTNWMDILGTYTSAANSITVDKILTSSAGGTTAVSFAAGTKNIFCTYPAATAVLAAPATYPTIQPSLNLDFANTKLLDPRITFVRNSTAAYYDGQTSALAEQNLLIYSEQFDNIAWGKSNTSVTANSIAAPDGTTTADTLTANGTSSAKLISNSNMGAGVILATAKTVSIYAKAGTNNYLQISFAGDAAPWADYDLSLGTVGSTGSNQTASIVSVGSGWYRCILYTASITATTFNVGIISSSSATRNEVNSLATDVYLWGAQLEQRSAVTAYTPTTTAAITKYIPVLMTAPAGVARFDYDPITGKPLGLLIEEGRSNLLTYSSDFSNGVWLKYAATTSATALISPDGTLNGNSIIEDATTNAHWLRVGTITKTANQVLTFSIYVKPNGRYLQTAMEVSGTGLYTTFDVLNNQYLDTVQPAGWTRGQTSIVSVGNGWYRCIISGTTDTSLTLNVRVLLANTYLNTSNQSYTGNGYSGIYIWGAQLEAGSFATSLIPTLATTVTRAADNASMTGTNFSSWYNQSEGSMYVDYDTFAQSTGYIFTISEGSGSVNYISLLKGNSGLTNRFVTVSTSVNQGNIDIGSISLNTNYKIIGSYITNNNNFCVNGGTVANDSTVTLPPNINNAYFGTYFTQSMNGHIRKLSYYPVALSSANLVALTS